MEMTRKEALEILKEHKIEIDIKERRTIEKIAIDLIQLGSAAIHHEIIHAIHNGTADSDTNQ